MASERLGELGRLAVTDAVRDLAHGEHARGEQIGGAIHPHLRQVVAERRVPDLRVGTLELTSRGGRSAGDVVEREVGRVVALDDRVRLFEKAGAKPDG